ncbi:MAG TPA: glycosyltransferase [Oligoflexia bacterium]|nr:glycosyltransferase [Oligoflexia bacterium]HMP48353.1 glycosyltransferase [Oligoflexia bacterium]
MKLSIVTTLYNSAEFIDEFYKRSTIIAKKFAGTDYEIIFVDDGSPDDSGKIVKNIITNDKNVILVELSRNFGHHNAGIAGVRISMGDFVFFLDCDLEDEPELLDRYYDEMLITDADIVYGIQNDRQGNLYKKFSGLIFYYIFNACSEIKIPHNITSGMLGRRDFVNAINRLGDKNLFIPANLAWLGFRTAFVSVNRKLRVGKTNYTLFRKLNLAFNAITSFTAYPLRMILLVGIILSFTFGSIGLYIVINKFLYNGKIFDNWSIIVSIWFIGGLVILFMGVIGIYLSKIYNEVKDRPQYFIRKVYQMKD